MQKISEQVPAIAQPEISTTTSRQDPRLSETIPETTEEEETTGTELDNCDPAVKIIGKPDPADKEVYKVVCGLPCTSRRREKKLAYTMEILLGKRSKKIEDDMQSEVDY
jgi:hypothetical protein